MLQRLLCFLAALALATTSAADEPGRPFATELTTTWGEQVAPENAWAEYPRPQLRRDDWTCLNGTWEYAIGGATLAEPPPEWDGEILVPFCLESKLGGVRRLLAPDEALWYRRTFEAQPTDEERTLLHFEAVDHRCQVFVNGTAVGSHVGGNVPFAIDVTHALREGENELRVRVEDDTEAWQLRGKQVLEPKGIWYTRVSGIWQTVWLEQVPERHIADLTITTDLNPDGTADIAVAVEAVGDDTRVLVSASSGGVEAGRQGSGERAATVNVAQPRLWSPDDPHLYDLTVTLVDADGATLDTVKSYAGIRTVGTMTDAEGHKRLTLNGKPLFHWGTLDQGWWPDGLLTPPSDEAMRSDIEYLKAAGFNMIRKHIKVEPRRYYWHCDRLGMMVWQDHVSGAEEKDWPEWTRLKPNPPEGTWPPREHDQFMAELDAMIDALESHPSIVCWVPLNERWGQHQTVEIGDWTRKRDPRRLVNIASGGNFWPVGDIVDAHSYPHPAFPFEQDGGRFGGFVKVMGEFGGHGYPVEGHLYDPGTRNWGYGGLPKDEAEWRDRYRESLRRLIELKSQGIAAGVYTQTTDVEGEINGLLTYDRRVRKLSAAELAEMHRPLFERGEGPE